MHVLALVFCFSVFLFCATAADPQLVAFTPLKTEAAAFERVDFKIQFNGTYSNAFDPDEIAVDLEVEGPVKFRHPAFIGQRFERSTHGQDWFYPEGKPEWQARVAFLQSGEYSVRAAVRDHGGIRTSDAVKITVRNPRSHGYLRVARKDPRFLEFTDGTPFFAIGQNLAFIGAQQYASLSKTEQMFKTLSENGANYLRIWTCCEDWAMAIEARKSAFGRSWDWRPPFAPVPGQETMQCLKLSRERRSVRVDPSHRVALRPDTKYLLKLNWQAPQGGRVTFNILGKRESTPVSTGSGWQSASYNFTSSHDTYWLGGFELASEGDGEAFVRDISLREEGGGPELLWEADMNRPIRGYYNQLDCFLLDEVLEAAEKNGLYLQLCMLTRDLYMKDLKDPTSGDYARAIADAKKFFRYAIARWGYSTSVAAWEYWNELDPGLPTDAFYAAMGEFFELNDTYRHLRTTSTWGPSPTDCRHPKLDIADTHFYLRPSDRPRLINEVGAVLDRTQWLRTHAPNKPAHLGEFGLADEKWGITEEMKRSTSLADVHNALWASALSGASGTALFWWWERLDQKNAYPLYKQVAEFTREIPWNSGSVTNLAIACEKTELRAIGLAAEQRAWFWVFSPDGSWDPARTGSPAKQVQERLVIRGLADSDYIARWVDTKSGAVVKDDRERAANGMLELVTPEFRGDIACTITPDRR